MAAIDEADVCLLVMDSQELNVAMDQKLAGIIADAGKGLVLVASKWDLIEKDTHTQHEFSQKIANNYQHVAWAPLVFTSGETGKNVTQLLELVNEIQTNRQQKFATRDLNRVLRHVVMQHPPSGPAGKRIHPRLKYMVQTDSSPPWFVIHGSKARQTHWSYRRYLEKGIRANWELAGTPVNLSFRDDDNRREPKK